MFAESSGGNPAQPEYYELSPDIIAEIDFQSSVSSSLPPRGGAFGRLIEQGERVLPGLVSGIVGADTENYRVWQHAAIEKITDALEMTPPNLEGLDPEDFNGLQARVREWSIAHGYAIPPGVETQSPALRVNEEEL